MKPTYEELEQKLVESQREFRAADATIVNLQMQVEKLAAESAGVTKTDLYIALRTESNTDILNDKHLTICYMSNIDKQELIAKIKKQTESYDTVVLREDEANALLDELEAKEKRIAELEAREVKVPELKMLRDYLAEVTHREREDILVGVRLEFFRALEEAGVKAAATAGKGE